MRSLLVCSILSLGLAWAQHSIAAPVDDSAVQRSLQHQLDEQGKIYRHALGLDRPAEAKPKHAAPAACDGALDDYLHAIAANSKQMAISPRLTTGQFSFVQSEIKKHSKDHKSATGDGAIVIDSDGQFLLAVTTGNPAGAVNVCTIVPIPAELVAAIVAIDAPPAAVETPPAAKVDPERPWL